MDLILIGEVVIGGALVGLMYALAAVGLVLVYKTSGIVNLAHGALVMTGAFVVWALEGLSFLNIWTALLLSFPLMFGLGVAIERTTLRPVIGQPLIMIVMITLGIEILLLGLVPGIFGSASKRINLGIPDDPVFLGDIFISATNLYSGLISLALLLVTIVLFNTRLGVRMRAAADDPVAALSIGIRVSSVVAISWGLAAVTGTVAGVLWGNIQGVNWTISLLLIKALAIAILGGLDSVSGVIVAGLFVGICESLSTTFLDPLVGGGTREVVAAVIILITLAVRPHGLFGRAHIERV